MVRGGCCLILQVGNKVVYIIAVEDEFTKVRRLLSSDSNAIGVFYDPGSSYYFVLTKWLNLYYYNRKTHTLERRGNFDDGKLNRLMV